MHSSGAFIRTHLCTKSCIESKSAFITFCMKHPSSGLMTHHVQRCLRRVMTPSVPWWVGHVCCEWGEGLDKVHSVPAPVSVPILHLNHSLHCSSSPSTQLQVTSWTTFVTIEPSLTSCFSISKISSFTIVLSSQKHSQFLEHFLTCLPDFTIH